MVATLTRNSIQAAAGQIFLVPTPTTVVGATTAAIVTELYAKFFASGDTRMALASGITPWAVLDKNGYKDKIVAKEIKADPNDGPEFTVGWESIQYSSEITQLDCDAAHMVDILSAAAANLIATTASATQAGRQTFVGGGQRIPADFMLLYRYPSRRAAGEFNSILVPAAQISLNADRENSKSKVRDLKINITAKPFDLLPDPVTGFGTLWLEDTVINPHS